MTGDLNWLSNAKLTLQLNHQHPKGGVCLSMDFSISLTNVCEQTNENPHCVVENTVSYNILTRCLDLKQQIRMLWWSTTSKNVCQASYIMEKEDQVSMSSSTSFHLTLHHSLSQWPLFQGSVPLARVEKRPLTVISVSISASWQTQFTVSLFHIVPAFCWFLVSAAVSPSNTRAAQILWLVQSVLTVLGLVMSFIGTCCWCCTVVKPQACPVLCLTEKKQSTSK